MLGAKLWCIEAVEYLATVSMQVISVWLAIGLTPVFAAGVIGLMLSFSWLLSMRWRAASCHDFCLFTS